MCGSGQQRRPRCSSTPWRRESLKSGFPDKPGGCDPAPQRAIPAHGMGLLPCPPAPWQPGFWWGGAEVGTESTSALCVGHAILRFSPGALGSKGCCGLPRLVLAVRASFAGSAVPRRGVST